MLWIHTCSQRLKRWDSSPNPTFVSEGSFPKEDGIWTLPWHESNMLTGARRINRVISKKKSHSKRVTENGLSNRKRGRKRHRTRGQRRGQGSWKGRVQEDGGQTHRETRLPGSDTFSSVTPAPWHGLSPSRLSLFSDWLKKELLIPSQSISEGRSQDQGNTHPTPSHMLFSLTAPLCSMCPGRPVQLEWRRVVWDEPGGLGAVESMWKVLISLG